MKITIDHLRRAVDDLNSTARDNNRDGLIGRQLEARGIDDEEGMRLAKTRAIAGMAFLMQMPPVLVGMLYESGQLSEEALDIHTILVSMWIEGLMTGLSASDLAEFDRIAETLGE